MIEARFNNHYIHIYTIILLQSTNERKERNWFKNVHALESTRCLKFGVLQEKMTRNKEEEDEE